MMTLTKLQLQSLSAGTKIQVTWHGGNGPHEYDLSFDKWGNPFASIDRGVFVGRLPEDAMSIHLAYDLERVEK